MFRSVWKKLEMGAADTEEGRREAAIATIQHNLRRPGLSELAHDTATIHRFAATRNYDVKATLELFYEYRKYVPPPASPRSRGRDESASHVEEALLQTLTLNSCGCSLSLSLSLVQVAAAGWLAGTVRGGRAR